MSIYNSPHLRVTSRAQLREWLAANYLKSQPVWLVYPKKTTGVSDLDYDVIVEELLCFGWIDSLPGKVDQNTTKLYISPRKKGSGWSRINKVRITELDAQNLLSPHAREIIEQAKRDGSWTLLDDSEKGIPPRDLAEALDKNSKAKDYFDSLSLSKKKMLIQKLVFVKLQQTRDKWIQKYIEFLKNHIYPL